jgi:hypothetical protein
VVELKDEIRAGNVTSFRLFSENSSGRLWGASFGYSTTNFGGFFHIDAQCVKSLFGAQEFVAFIRKVCDSSDFKYAIFYEADDVSAGFYYAQGENLVSLYSYENPVLFARETGGRFRGAERYNNEMLRMVYPINVLNKMHLRIDVEGMMLRDWILSDGRHGTLGEMPNGMWIWQVEEKDLGDVNAALGASGILISWKPPRSLKASRILL